MARIRLRLVTPSSQLLDREVDEVQVPGEVGSFGVRPGHAALLSTLGAGTLTMIDGNETQRFVLVDGFVEAGPESVVVLAAEAIPAAEVDAAEAKTQIDKALEEMSGQAVDSVEYTKAAAKLRRARALSSL